MSDNATKSLESMIEEMRQAVIKSAKNGVRASAEITATGLMAYGKNGGLDLDLGASGLISGAPIKAEVETGINRERQSTGAGQWWLKVRMETE